MNRALLQRNLAQTIRLLRRKSVSQLTVSRQKHQIFELPARVAEREIFLLKYACAACEHGNEEILLASMFQTNLVMVNCSNCGGRHALGTFYITPSFQHFSRQNYIVRTYIL